mgnify:CR=1 FL=1
MLRKRNGGFTLIEIFVALFILTITGLTIIYLNSPIIQNYRVSEQQVKAAHAIEAWLDSTDQWPPIGASEIEYTHNEINWRFVSHVSQYENKDLRKHQVQAYLTYRQKDPDVKPDTTFLWAELFVIRGRYQ